ncbi:MAG TPA: hypothetical protein VFB90_01775 [Dehalococcoidia bacterium]|nr:hypothetical protein [Dehalococcoidia bacterium]
MSFYGLSEYENIDERHLKGVLQRANRLDREVRRWTLRVLELLPRGLPLMGCERELVSFYLSEQRRRNLELDDDFPRPFAMSQLLPFLRSEQEDAGERMAHHLVSCHLEDDIERVVLFFSRECQVSEMSESIIDWRVSLRYLAQRLYAFAEGGRPLSAARAFEPVARQLVQDVREKRRALQLATPVAAGS